MSPQERLEAAVISGEKIHPGYRTEVARGVSVCWHKAPFSEGAWRNGRHVPAREAISFSMNPTDRSTWLGEDLSYLTGWREGSVLSAHRVVGAITERSKARK